MIKSVMGQSHKPIHTVMILCWAICAMSGAYAAYSLPALIRDWQRMRVSENVAVFESDDWYPVSCVINSPDWPATNVAFDLTELAATLRRHRDAVGHHPVFTLNMILTQPDFAAIERSKFEEYAWVPLDQIAPEVVSIIRRGMAEGVFWPQAHGREHFHALRWLEDLQRHDRSVHDAFKQGRVALRAHRVNDDTSIHGGARKGRLSIAQRRDYLFRATTSPLIPAPGRDWGIDDDRYVNDWVKSTQEVFSDAFGFQSRSWIAPSYCWTTRVEGELERCGVRYIQGANTWTTAVAPSGAPTLTECFFGERSAHGQIYLERNVLFEPKLGSPAPLFDWLGRVTAAWDHNLPAVITGHANKFQGEDQRPFGRRHLDELLAAMCRRNVIFLTSEQLGDLAANGEIAIDGPGGRRVVTTAISNWARLRNVLSESTKASVGLIAAVVSGIAGYGSTQARLKAKRLMRRRARISALAEL